MASRRLGIDPLALQAGHGIAKVIYNLVTQGITSRRLLSRCPFFKPLVEAEANEDTLSYLPSLLAWDLEALQRKNPTVACFAPGAALLE